jgi:hypothetical protein
VDNFDFGEPESNIIQTASVNERQPSESRHHLKVTTHRKNAGATGECVCYSEIRLKTRAPLVAGQRRLPSSSRIRPARGWRFTRSIVPYAVLPNPKSSKHTWPHEGKPWRGKAIEWRRNALALGTNANRARFEWYERFITLAPQSAFTRPAIPRSQAGYAGA